MRKIFPNRGHIFREAVGKNKSNKNTSTRRYISGIILDATMEFISQPSFRCFMRTNEFSVEPINFIISPYRSRLLSRSPLGRVIVLPRSYIFPRVIESAEMREKDSPSSGSLPDSDVFSLTYYSSSYCSFYFKTK